MNICTLLFMALVWIYAKPRGRFRREDNHVRLRQSQSLHVHWPRFVQRDLCQAEIVPRDRAQQLLQFGSPHDFEDAFEHLSGKVVGLALLAPSFSYNIMPLPAFPQAAPEGVQRVHVERGPVHFGQTG